MSTIETAPNPTIVNLTDAALSHLRAVTQQGHYGVRVGVSGGGCAGLQYLMGPCGVPNAEDLVQTIGEGDSAVRVVLHPMVVPYLKGLTIDFSTALVDGGFKFINPNATSTCGCGTSFGV